MDLLKSTTKTEETIGLLTEKVELPTLKPKKLALLKMLIALVVLIPTLFIGYVSFIISFKRSDPRLQNFPDFGFFKCKATLPFHSLQIFEFDPKEYTRFGLSGYAEYSESDVELLTHTDSPNVKILYEVKASDKYTLDNVKLSVNKDYMYQFNVDAPRSWFLFRHCISLKLSLSFPKSLKYFDDLSLNLQKPKRINLSNETIINQLSLYSYDSIYISGFKSNNLFLNSFSNIFLSHIQVNTGTIHSYNGGVFAYNITTFPFNYNGSHKAAYNLNYKNHTKFMNRTYTNSQLRISGKYFVSLNHVNFDNVHAFSDGSALVHNVSSKYVTVNSKNSAYVSGSISHLEVNNMFNNLNVSVSDSTYISAYNKGKTSVHIQSLGVLTTVDSISTPYYNVTSKAKGYFFEISSLLHNANLTLPESFTGSFEAIASSSGKASVSSNSKQDTIHFEESEVNLKKGYFGIDKVATNQVKVQSAGCYADAVLNFY